MRDTKHHRVETRKRQTRKVPDPISSCTISRHTFSPSSPVNSSAENRRHGRRGTWNRLIKMSMPFSACRAIFTGRFQLAPLQPLLTLSPLRIISLDVQTTKRDICQPPEEKISRSEGTFRNIPGSCLSVSRPCTKYLAT